MRRLLVTLVVTAAACGSDPGPVEIPVGQPGASELDCQRLCTLAAGDDHCTAKRAAFCVASCRTE